MMTMNQKEKLQADMFVELGKAFKAMEKASDLWEKLDDTDDPIIIENYPLDGGFKEFIVAFGAWAFSPEKMQWLANKVSK